MVRLCAPKITEKLLFFLSYFLSVRVDVHSVITGKYGTPSCRDYEANANTLAGL